MDIFSIVVINIVLAMVLVSSIFTGKRNGWKLELGKLIFTLGAGVSSSAGLPSWDKLLQSMIKQSSQCDNSEDYSNNLNKDSDNSSIIKGRYIKMLYNNDDNNFVTSIKNALNVSANNSLLIRNIGNAIKTKRINQIITYNYDDLIENELDLSGIKYAISGGDLLHHFCFK